MKQKWLKLTMGFIVAILTGWTAQAQMEKKTVLKAQTQEQSLAAATAAVEPNINWKDWENQFSDAVDSGYEAPQKCVGKNCSFKDKTALDPSFEF